MTNVEPPGAFKISDMVREIKSWPNKWLPFIVILLDHDNK